MTTSNESAISPAAVFGRGSARRYPGVVQRGSYSGGDVPNATYHNHGTHAEAIEIVYDPKLISYRKLLESSFRSTIRPR